MPRSRLNPLFELVRTVDRFAPARGMIREVFSTYVDRDGNFLEQFQTTGFDSRIWELYLHAYFVDSGFNLLPSVSPDFVVSKGSVKIGVEAVTANPTQGLDPRQKGYLYSSTRLISSPSDALITEEDGAFAYKQKDFVPIKLGSALYSKLQKRYWESASMDSVPLVFAIETFHDAASLYYSSAALATYLYGFRHEILWSTDERLLIVPRRVDTHFRRENHTVRVFLAARGRKRQCCSLQQQWHNKQIQQDGAPRRVSRPGDSYASVWNKLRPRPRRCCAAILQIPGWRPPF